MRRLRTTYMHYDKVPGMHYDATRCARLATPQSDSSNLMLWTAPSMAPPL